MITRCPFGDAARERLDRRPAMPPPDAGRTHRAYVIARRTVLALDLLVVAAIALRDAAPLVFANAFRLEALRPAHAGWNLIEAAPDTPTIAVQIVSSSYFDFDHVDVDERPDKVQVEAYIRHADGYICTADISYHAITIALSAPLAGRRLAGCSPSSGRSCGPAASAGEASRSGP